MAYNSDVILLRICRSSLGFCATDELSDSGVKYEPYMANNSISIAANLREAFKRSVLLSKHYNNATVLIDSRVMLLPADDFNKEDIDTLYRHGFGVNKGQEVIYSVVPQLSAVAVYAVDSDILTVLNDHFSELRTFPLTFPTWQILESKSYSATCRRLFAYFHDGMMEVSSYGTHRFKFYNTFIVKHINDAVYYLLSIWKQLGFDQENDELHIVGNISEREELINQLCRYLRGVYLIRPKIDFNSNPITKNTSLPYDTMCYFINN